jgi:hypothetical protein
MCVGFVSKTKFQTTPDVEKEAKKGTHKEMGKKKRYHPMRRSKLNSEQ